MAALRAAAFRFFVTAAFLPAAFSCRVRAAFLPADLSFLVLAAFFAVVSRSAISDPPRRADIINHHSFKGSRTAKFVFDATNRRSEVLDSIISGGKMPDGSRPQTYHRDHGRDPSSLQAGAQLCGGKRVPATSSAIADAVCWEEEIIRTMDAKRCDIARRKRSQLSFARRIGSVNHS